MASASAAVAQRNQDATVYVGGLDEKVDEELLWELFVQVNAFLVALAKSHGALILHRSL
jgi:hypothetical protein